MGFFASREKKEILRTRANQERILAIEKGDYLALNKLAQTWLDESNLPETKDKNSCLEKAVSEFKKSVMAKSLEAEPYIFLSEYYKATNPAYADEIERKGLDYLIMDGESRMREINKTVSPDQRIELHAKLALLCERFTARTKDRRYKEKLTQLIGGPEIYDMVLAYNSL